VKYFIHHNINEQGPQKCGTWSGHPAYLTLRTALPSDVEGLLESHNEDLNTQNVIHLSEFRSLERSIDEEKEIKN
jgi:hypothetical protein